MLEKCRCVPPSTQCTLETQCCAGRQATVHNKRALFPGQPPLQSTTLWSEHLKPDDKHSLLENQQILSCFPAASGWHGNDKLSFTKIILPECVRSLWPVNFQKELAAHLLESYWKRRWPQVVNSYLSPAGVGRSQLRGGRWRHCKLCKRSTAWRCEVCDVGLCLQPDRNCFTVTTKTIKCEETVCRQVGYFKNKQTKQQKFMYSFQFWLFCTLRETDTKKVFILFKFQIKHAKSVHVQQLQCSLLLFLFIKL